MRREFKLLQAGSGGGTSAHAIYFQIESVTCEDDGTKILYVQPTWYTGGCTKSIPGEDEYGMIEVIDPCSVLAYYTAEWLEQNSVTGRATYMYPRGAEYCEPQWLLDTICGQPACE